MGTVSRKIQHMLLSYSAHWNVVLSLEAYSPVDPGNTSEEGFEWNEVFSDGFYIEKVFQKRDGSCSNGSHPCSDINSTICCPNTGYCIVDENWEPACCDFGSVCGNLCDEDHYYSNQTITTTITSGSTSVFTQAVCTNRPCSGSFYECPSSLGGNCCGYGLDCSTDSAGSGVCMGVSAASTASKGGCGMGQFQCGGSSSAEFCCSSGELCTSTTASTTTSDSTSVSTVPGGYACRSLAQIVAGSTASSTPLASISTENTTSSTSLKIGLGVGIPVGLLCVGGLLLFAIFQRKARRVRRSGNVGSGAQIRNVYDKPELPDEPVKAPVELDALSEPPELVAGKGLRPELAGNEVIAELATRQDEV